MRANTGGNAGVLVCRFFHPLEERVGSSERMFSTGIERGYGTGGGFGACV